MKKLLLIVLLSASFPLWAQYRTGGILIILNNGDSIKSNYVGINNTSTLFKGPHVQLDPVDKQQRVNISEIKSIEGYDSKTQTYRYFRRLDATYNNVLAERTINNEHIQAYYFDAYYQSGMYGGGYSWRHLHYSKDGGPIVKANYSNLKRNLFDSPEAAEHLKKASSLRIAQYSLYAVGTGLIVTAVHSLVSQPTGPGQESSGSDNGLAYGIMGAVLLRIPMFLESPKRDHMEKALRAY